jgi:hypothetical protein
MRPCVLARTGAGTGDKVEDDALYCGVERLTSAEVAILSVGNNKTAKQSR